MNASESSRRPADLLQREVTGVADPFVTVCARRRLRAPLEERGRELAARLSPVPDPPLRDLVTPRSPFGVVRPGEPRLADLDLVVTAALDRPGEGACMESYLGRPPRSRRLERPRSGVGPGGG